MQTRDCGQFKGRSPERRAGTQGFTLLEVLVALSVMAMAVTLVLQLFSTNLRSVARSGDVTSAAVRADSRIREILMEPLAAETAWSEATDDGYRMDVSVREVLKDRTQNLPVRMMEVVLVIRWVDGIMEKRLELKTAKSVDRAARAGEV